MSFYTIFDTLESLITSTTTSAQLTSTDALIVHNVSANKKFQTTVGALAQVGAFGGSGGPTSATTNTTATNISATGFTLLKSTGGTTCQWQLADPTTKGQTCTLMFASSTTSTNFAVQTQTASIQCTGGSSANNINFASTASGVYVNWGQGVTLLSLTSTSWIVTAVQRNPTAVTSGVIFAVGTGPIFTSV